MSKKNKFIYYSSTKHTKYKILSTICIVTIFWVKHDFEDCRFLKIQIFNASLVSLLLVELFLHHFEVSPTGIVMDRQVFHRQYLTSTTV